MVKTEFRQTLKAIYNRVIYSSFYLQILLLALMRCATLTWYEGCPHGLASLGSVGLVTGGYGSF